MRNLLTDPLRLFVVSLLATLAGSSTAFAAPTTCSCPILLPPASEKHLLAPRVYDVRAIMEDCYVTGSPSTPCTAADDRLKPAIAAALSISRSHPYPVTAAKTLYFRPGAYRVREPIEITRDGVTLRGEAGHFLPNGGTAHGSYFVCDFGTNAHSEPCLTLGPATGSAQGVVLEDLAFENGTSTATVMPNVGVSLRNLQNPRVRRATFQAGHTNLSITGCTGGVVDDTMFHNTSATSVLHLTAIEVSGSVGLRLSRLGLGGGSTYDYGLLLEDVDDIIVDQGLSHGHMVAAIRLVDAGRVIVRGMRFENGEPGDVLSVARATPCSAYSTCPATDLVVGDSYFDMFCTTGIRPLVVESFATGGVPYPTTAPAPRVYLRGNTFYRVMEEIYGSDEPTALFQCNGNVMMQPNGEQEEYFHFTEGSCSGYSDLGFPVPLNCD